MQRIFCVKFTPDSKFVLTGSDDTNIRVWKANASETLGVVCFKMIDCVFLMRFDSIFDLRFGFD